jgi:hypothetical protein
MKTVFDVLTVACFAGLVFAFVRFTDRETRTLLQLMISAAAFAIANQMGNAGQPFFAIVLILAGSGYATLIVRQSS